MSAVVQPDTLDLRDRDHAARLEAVLQTLDLENIAGKKPRRKNLKNPS
jgi:hypothetical protein